MDLLVNIDVDDLDLAEKFYTSAFDLSVGRRFGNSGIELIGGSSRIYLLVKPAGTQATDAPGTARTYDRHWTPVHIDIVVADIEQAAQRALKAGAALERPVQSSAWGRLGRTLLGFTISPACTCRRMAPTPSPINARRPVNT